MNELYALFESQRKMSKLVALGNSFRTLSDIVSKFTPAENPLFETHRKMSRLLESSNSFKRTNDVFSKFAEAENKFRNGFLWFEKPYIYKAFSEKHNLLDRFLLGTSVFDRLKKLEHAFRSNPEFAFISIAELELLSLSSTTELANALREDSSDEFISAKEELLNEFLLPYLERLKLDYLWLGANYALNDANNPDRLRHALVSLRTLLESLIDGELAPNTELINSEMFKTEFRKYHDGKKKLENIKIKDRAKKIRFFTSKIQFGTLEEFTQKDIDLVCKCYSVLCNLHRPDVGLTENQVRILKIKTGIVLWLLAYVNEIIRNQN